MCVCVFASRRAELFATFASLVSQSGKGRQGEQPGRETHAHTLLAVKSSRLWLWARLKAAVAVVVAAAAADVHVARPSVTTVAAAVAVEVAAKSRWKAASAVALTTLFCCWCCWCVFASRKGSRVECVAREGRLNEEEEEGTVLYLAPLSEWVSEREKWDVFTTAAAKKTDWGSSASASATSSSSSSFIIINTWHTHSFSQLKITTTLLALERLF